MPARLLPLIVAPAILLPLAAYAMRKRQVRGAVWYAVLLVALAIWCGGYAWELSVDGLDAKLLALKAKYVGVLLMPVAWVGFIVDFVASDSPASRRIVTALGVVGAHPIYIAGAITALIGAALLWLPKARSYAHTTMQKRRSDGGLIKPKKPVA